MSEQDINEFCQKGGKILSFVSDEKYYAFEVKDVTDIIEADIGVSMGISGTEVTKQVRRLPRRLSLHKRAHGF